MFNEQNAVGLVATTLLLACPVEQPKNADIGGIGVYRMHIIGTRVDSSLDAGPGGKSLTSKPRNQCKPGRSVHKGGYCI
jgi:ABC-type uncharacterized transport system permease subunit